MKPKQVPIGEIKPDPRQPRKIFDEAHIKGLAKSLKIEGVINPIEIDKDKMIITGECRWRAAKLAGWKNVPVIVNEKTLSEYERLRRQMAENLHQSAAGGASPMNALDVANGYKRMIKMRTGKDYLPGQTSRKEVYGLIKGIPEELGISYDTIREYLKLFDEPKYVLEDIKKGRARTLYREASKIPEKYRDKMKSAIAEGKIGTRDDILRFSKLAKANPEKAEIEFLRITQQQSEDANRILNRAIELTLAMQKAVPTKFSIKDRSMVHSQLNSTMQSITRFIAILKEIEKNEKKR